MKMTVEIRTPTRFQLLDLRAFVEATKELPAGQVVEIESDQQGDDVITTEVQY